LWIGGAGLVLIGLVAWLGPVPTTAQAPAPHFGKAPYVAAFYTGVGLGAAIPATTLVSVAAAGMYGVSSYAQVTTAAALACVETGTVGFTYNGAAKTIQVFSANGNVADYMYPGYRRTFRVDAGTNISLSGTDSCAGAHAYDAYLQLEKLQ
jgi:hypothetical protein